MSDNSDCNAKQTLFTFIQQVCSTKIKRHDAAVSTSAAEVTITTGLIYECVKQVFRNVHENFASGIGRPGFFGRPDQSLFRSANENARR